MLHAGAGAGAGAIAEIASGSLGDLTEDQQIEVAKLIGGLAAFVTSGGNAQDVNIGAEIAGSAIAFNRQLHRAELELIKSNAQAFAINQGWCGTDSSGVCNDGDRLRAQRVLTQQALLQVDSIFGNVPEHNGAADFLFNLAIDELKNAQNSGFPSNQNLFYAEGAQYKNHLLNIQYVKENIDLSSRINEPNWLDDFKAKIGCFSSTCLSNVVAIGEFIEAMGRRGAVKNGKRAVIVDESGGENYLYTSDGDPVYYNPLSGKYFANNQDIAVQDATILVTAGLLGNATRFPVNTIKIKPVILGLEDHLDTFTKNMGGESWKTWAKNSPDWRFTFNEIMHSGRPIKFNLTDVNNPHLSAGRAASGQGSNTDWELLQIRTNPHWWKRMEFYDNGVKVPNPFE